jgi:2-polyprenyl-3-methyl-5-hydroxy-6-metoxy-1,4-benzoquinol methylase
LRQFWQARHARHGHTGWSDGVIYAYDQLERLALVRGFIERLPSTPRRALDYGCGAGDFSRLLLSSGAQVWGFDPFVEPAIRDPSFSYVATLDAVADLAPDLDVIVSVTVLDHILDEAEILRVLHILRSRIAPSGTLLLIEYAFDAVVTRPASDYQALRRLNDWYRLLTLSGWSITSVRPVPTLPESPSAGFREYQRSPVVAILRPIVARTGSHTGIAGGLLRRYARHVFSRHGAGIVPHSPLKLIQCAPSDAGPEAIRT